MLRSYEDLTRRLGVPLWYDDNGVPRYDPFRPDLCGIYARFIALAEIACQACGDRFKVAFERRNFASDKHPWVPIPESVNLLHYGDPPPHGCSGDTMNCLDLRVLEFWRRDGDPLAAWRRDHDLEILMRGSEEDPWQGFGR
jgi:hypothetical protein